MLGPVSQIKGGAHELKDDPSLEIVQQTFQTSATRRGDTGLT